MCTNSRKIASPNELERSNLRLPEGAKLSVFVGHFDLGDRADRRAAGGGPPGHANARSDVAELSLRGAAAGEHRKLHPTLVPGGVAPNRACGNDGGGARGGFAVGILRVQHVIDGINDVDAYTAVASSISEDRVPFQRHGGTGGGAWCAALHYAARTRLLPCGVASSF